MIMIKELASELTTHQRPVLCLDTCILIDVIQGVVHNDFHHPKYARKLLDSLTASPDAVQLVATFLVRHEWDQKKGEWDRNASDSSYTDRHKELKAKVAEIDENIGRLAEVCRLQGLSYTDHGERFASLRIVESLVGLAEDLLGRAIILGRDDGCVERALGRVLDKKRPSQDNRIKDSIHWEHYLELSRQLVAAGHDQDRFFVSSDKAAFWSSKDSQTLNNSLRAEAKEAGLKFFGRLNEPMIELGIEI